MLRFEAVFLETSESFLGYLTRIGMLLRGLGQ
jgi:hypothetical protein